MKDERTHEEILETILNEICDYPVKCTNEPHYERNPFKEIITCTGNRKSAKVCIKGLRMVSAAEIEILRVKELLDEK